MKTGLVMEGGAMRGLFTAGVTDVWMENGIEFVRFLAAIINQSSREEQSVII